MVLVIVLTEAIVLSVVDAVIVHRVEQTQLGEKVRNWMELNSARFEFKKEVLPAYNAFARAIKKSELYSSLWTSCNELRGSTDASQYKN